MRSFRDFFATLTFMVWTLLFDTLPTQAHVHVQVGFANRQWNLHLLDFESGEIASDELALVVGLAARTQVPNDARYTHFLGAAGSTVWILPQNENPELLNLGIGVSGVGSGVFIGNQIRLALHRVDGPGHFSLFTTTALGAPSVHMNSSDGINPAQDFIVVPTVGGHLHLNWGFTKPGVYRVGFVASGQLSSNNQTSESAVVDYTFIVIAPPAPKLIQPRFAANGEFTFTLESEAQRVCEVESSSDLISWQPVITVTNTVGQMEMVLPANGSSNVFYRVLSR